MPTDSEYSTLENVVEVLKPLAYLTDALSGEKQVTGSAILPILKHVETKLALAAGDNQLVTDMKQAMWSDLKARYADPMVSETLNVASLLDPRFKDSMQSNNGAIEKITEECLTYHGSLHGDSGDPPVRSEEASTESTETEGPPPKCLKGLAAILKHIQEESEQSRSSSPLTPSEVIDKEISAYLDFPGADSDTDTLAWWKCEQGRFPHLAHIARKYLCICGTSVPSERVFSTAGHIASRSRGRLLPQNVSKLLFLAKNMK